jgi:hypothetical protein
MLQKKDIEAILKVNGVLPTSPEEEIRSVLISARYNNEDIDTAVMVLRENTVTNKTRVDGLHKIFRSDDALRPSEISALLGIDVEVDHLSIRRNASRDMSIIQNAIVTVVAIVLAIFGVTLAMYSYQVGVFHPSSVTSK